MVGARRYVSDRSEHEYAALADQMNALKDDIRHARECSTEARRSPGMTTHLGAEAATPLPHGQPVALADGAIILIRPVEPNDARQLNACFDHLSKQQLTYLTDVDHERHEALVALHPVTGESVGVARSLRDAEDPGRADVTVVVADLWQGHGVGSALIERLAARARAAGVERFRARMLIGNRAGHRLLERVAEEIDEHEDAAAIELSARLRTFPQEAFSFAPHRYLTTGPLV